MTERTYLSTLSATSSAPQPEAETDERSMEEIRRDIAARRDSIVETVDRLGEQIQRTLDWREYIRQHPLLALGAAAGAGWLLSALFRPRPTAGERIFGALADGVEEVTDRLRSQLNAVGLESTGGLGRTIKAALTATVTKAGMDYLTSRMQGSRPAADALPHNYRSEEVPSMTASSHKAG